MDFEQGRRQRGGQWYPAHAFEICAPISGLAPWLLHTSNTVFFKCGPPLWFLTHPAADFAQTANKVYWRQFKKMYR